MSRLQVNRSGLAIPVWNQGLIAGIDCTGPNPTCVGDKSLRVGTLLANEFARRSHSDIICPVCLRFSEEIWFLSPSGWRWGHLHWDDLLDKIGHNTSILAFPLRLETIGGTTQRVYTIQNRAEELIKRTSTLTPYNPIPLPGSPLPVGTEIATDSSTMGATFLDYWVIQWVKRSGVWTRADEADNAHGFIDTGLRLGSGPNTLSIRTSLAT